MKKFLPLALSLFSATLASTASGQSKTYTNGEVDASTRSTNGDITLTVNGTDTATQGTLNGDGTVTKSGSGTLTFSGSNTYSGGTTISGGTLSVADATKLGTGDVTASGGGVLSATLLEFSGPRTISVDGSGSTLTAGYLWLNRGGSADTQTLNITNGGTVASTSTVSFADENAGSVGNLNVTGTDSTLSADGNIYIGYTGTGTASVGSGGIITTNAILSIATLGGSHGTFNLNDGGTIQVGGNGGIAFGAGTGVFNANGGTIRTTGSALTSTAAMTLGDSTTSTIDTNGFATTLSGVLSGDGALAKTGFGTLTLSGANTYSGATTINGGSLSIAADSGLGTAPGSPTAGHLTLDGGTLATTATFTLDANRGIALGASGGTLDTADATTLTYGGFITGSGSLTKTGTGTLTVFGDNTYSGGTIISGGTLVLTNLSDHFPLTTLGTGSILVNNGATLSSLSEETNLNQAITIQGTGSTLSTLYIPGSGEFSIGQNGAGSLTVTDGGSVVIDSQFFKLGSESSSSQATVTLSGSGSSIDASGTVQVGNALPSSVTVSDHATINMGFEFKLSQNGTLTVSSGAIATITNINNSGVINLNAAGTLSFLRPGPGFGSDSFHGTINFAGGTFQVSATDLFTNNLATLAAGTSNTFNIDGVNLIWNGVISGTGGLTKIGTGTLTLAGANTYTGDTIISAGTVSLAADNASLSYGGAISGAGNLAKAGSSTTTLTGDNTYAGTTAVDAGTLVFADRGAYYGGALDATTAGHLTIATGATGGFGVGVSGYFSESDLGTLLTSASFANGARLGLDTSNASGGTFTYAGTLADTNSGANSLGLDKLGTGNLTLGSANTYTGGTVVRAGTLTLGHASALGSTSANLTLNGGTLDLGTFTPTVGTAIFNGGTFTNGTLDNATAFEVQTGTLAANLGGTAGLTKTGTGAFILSGDNTYGGTTTVSAGQLTFADRGAYYGGTLDATTAGQLTVASGTTAAFGVGDAGYFSIADLAVIQANTHFASGSSLGLDTSNATAGAFTWNDAATGTLNLVKGGTGTLVLSGTATGTGTLSVNEGTLRFTGNAAAFPYATLNHAGTVDFNQSNEVTITGNETGTGALNITGGGTVSILGGLLDGTGDLTISHGTLNSASGSRDINRTIVVSGANSELSLGTGGMRIGPSGGEGSLRVENGGTVTYASTSTVSSTSLVVGNTGTGTVTVTGNGSTFTTESGIRIGRNAHGTLTISDGGVFTGNNTAATSIAQSSTTTGAINLSGTGSQLNLAGQLTVGFAGTGTIDIGSGATLTADRLQLALNSGSTGTLNLNAGGTLIVSDATDTALSTGSGTATFNFAGGTLKSNGTHSLTVSSNATLADGTTSTFDTNGQAGTFSGILSGSGSLTKAGSGTLTLTAANTTTGTFTIAGGTLALDADATIANSSGVALGNGGILNLTAKSGGFSFGTGQTLSGTGTVNLASGQALTVAGTLAPGNSPGIVTVNGDLVFDSTAIINLEIGGLVRGTDYDGFDVSGALTLNGTLNITFINGYTPATNTTFQLFDFGSLNGNFAAFNLPGLNQGLSWDTSSLDDDGTLSILMAVPEPAACGWLAGLSGLGMAVFRRRRRAMA